ncbi:MAG: GNAT family N-acetyltransferase [Candidatus Bathyarchaeia archaeon]
MNLHEGKIRIANLENSNLEDLIFVCSSQKLNDPIHQRGINLKKRWLSRMMEEHGTCAKIAYYNQKPVAQILYFSEEADVTRTSRRENVLVINCIYNPTPEAQKHGIGKTLLKSVIEDAKQRKTCLGNKACRFILAKAFNTGELVPLYDFYRKYGFKPTIERDDLLYLPVEGFYEPAETVGEYKPLDEDKSKTIIFYNPICQFSYPFAKTIEDIVKEVAPETKTELINEWAKPDESIKRKNCQLIVNAKPIHTFFLETEKFKEEVKQAAESKT